MEPQFIMERLILSDRAEKCNDNKDNKIKFQIDFIDRFHLTEN